ncbi:MAG: AAA family ATPase [Pyrinomonadaceae bacterium]|nr:AAA family ATPase [Pyrinomonadaceae bacterium]
MSLYPNSQSLVASLTKTFNELYDPLDASIRTVWRGKSAPPDGRTVFHNQLISIAQHFVSVTHYTAPEKQRYFEEICRFFNFDCAGYTFALPQQGTFQPNIADKLDRVPVVVSYLEAYDLKHGSNYSDRAKSALFSFANLVVKSGGIITKEEEAALQKFKETLYPIGSVGPHGPAFTTTTQQQTASVEAVAEEPPRPLQDLMEELNRLVGLERVKTEVQQLVNFLKVQQMRKEKGMKLLPVSRHLVFYGNPGTGKTTVARLLAQIFRTLEILSQGQLVETDRAGMVAGYVGHTALKVKEMVTKALGGVLFVDEAYALSPQGGGNDFGHEAVETLLKMMEDHRDDLIVIAAGYTEKMNEFLASNPGLRSRFNKFLYFEDYNEKLLVEIFKVFCQKADFKVTAEAEQKLLHIFSVLYAARDESFGNARLARNLFETAISKQANRIVALADINEEVLATIEAADVPGIEELQIAGHVATAEFGEGVN